MGKTWIIPKDAIQPTINKEAYIEDKIYQDEKSQTVLIVGGGISGVFAAIRIKEKHPSFKVSIFEKNNKLLRKIYATGNGRCNFANQGILTKKYTNDDFVLPIIQEFSYAHIVRYFDKLGIKYKSVNDLLYPMSDSAETVALMLNKKVEELKLEIHLEESVIDYTAGHLITNKGMYHYDHLIIAAGGKAAPQFGSDGSIFNILIKHGYSLVEARPSLCPIKVKENVNLIEGIRAKARVSLIVDGKQKHIEDGELLFKKNGLSGIVIFNISHFINAEKNSKLVQICIDFAPDCGKIEKDQYVQYLHPRLASYLVRNNLDIHRTVYTFKGLFDFLNAQVTSGGVSINEVNSNLSSFRENKVCFIGEVIDVDGVCGGFNIMWALASAEKVSNNLFAYGKESTRT